VIHPSKIAVTVGLSAFLGLAGAGVAFAVSGGSPATGSSSSTSTSLPAKGPHGRPGGPLGSMGIGGGVVHGRYTVKSGAGYKTIDVQVGSVSAVTPTSVTVVSSDGFSATYVVQASTVVDSQAGGISSVAKTDQVRIEGLVSGNNTTATSIIDITKIGASRKGFGLPEGGPMGPGGPGRAGTNEAPPAARAAAVAT
jgi:hypothetical protein